MGISVTGFNNTHVEEPGEAGVSSVVTEEGISPKCGRYSRFSFSLQSNLMVEIFYFKYLGLVVGSVT